MVKYDNKDWTRLIFSWRYTSLDRIWPRIIIFVVLAAGIYIAHFLYKINLEINPLGHSLVGVALGLLLVFRNNSSYKRYWEGRKAWRSIINTSRNLTREVSVYTGSAKEFVKLISAFVLALKQRLRNNPDHEELKPYLPESDGVDILSENNIPIAISYLMSKYVKKSLDAGKAIGPQARQLEELIEDLVNNQGICELIIKTPVPFCHASHIKKLLFIYLLTLPFVLVPLMNWFGIFMTAFVAFGLMGIEEAGVEIEDPFGLDPNDLPIDEMCDQVVNECLNAVEFEEKIKTKK